eukprot:g4079.t1
MSPTEHEPPTQAAQSSLIAIAEELAADEKRVLQQAGKMIETQEEFAAFHDAFFKKLAAQVAENIGKATDSSLEKHGIPEEVVMKVTEFQETADVLPSILPGKVVALPRDVVDELWEVEIKRRRKEWREEGERLVTREIQEIAKKGGEKKLVLKNNREHPKFLQLWLSKFPAPPYFLTEPEQQYDAHTRVADMVIAFEAAGYFGNYKPYRPTNYKNKQHKDECSHCSIITDIWLTW